MVRWRAFLVLGLLLVLPTLTRMSDDDEDDEKAAADGDEDEEDNDDDDGDDVDSGEKRVGGSKKLSKLPPTPRTQALSITRTLSRRPLECYTCAYKVETPLRACLDPTQYKVHVITCHNMDDKCFTSVISKGHNYEAVVRGCRTACVGTTETSCCEVNRCNNQAFAMPSPQTQKLMARSKSSKAIHPTVFFFVTILLVLQTVVKVAFV